MANRLVFIGPAGIKPSFGTTSWLNYRDIRDQSKLLKDVAGLYGVLSQLVSYRRQGSILIGSGLLFGLLLAFATGRLAESFLYEVRAADVLTYLAVAVASSAVGLIAILLPARKAASIEPVEALRDD